MILKDVRRVLFPDTTKSLGSRGTPQETKCFGRNKKNDMHALFAIFNILLSSTQTHFPVFYDHNNADGNKLCTKKGVF